MVACVGFNTHATQAISVIPKPANVLQKPGEFKLESGMTLGIPADSLKNIAEEFAANIKAATGIKLDVLTGSPASILLKEDRALSAEGYQLNVTKEGVVIKASSKEGFLYGLHTLRQILSGNLPEKGMIPYLEIEDSPRFGYRGLMVDVARYFVPKEELLKLIDAMSLLKLNKMHLHLTDDNGWRIEIKQYPKLTEIGAWSVDRGDTPFPARENPKPGEKATKGGFYTQEDLKEIVAYAAKNGIEVIPEIDMPAHANAALAAYPELACPVVDKFIGVLPGLGGDHADIIYCAGNDSVFVFLQNVIDEVIDIFPSKYIHLGGDEAWKTYWDICELCNTRIEEEQLADSEELQGWFMAKMSDYVHSKGREVIGWDELTNSRIPEDAIIMGWQGMGNAALKGAEQGHRFIMTPARLLYFIRYQGPQWFEPYTYFAGGNLQDVYEYEPVKEDWNAEYEDLLMGVQASMWNEFTGTPKAVEYQLFPRLTALAEVAWSPKNEKSWQDYLIRLDNFLPLLDSMDITYAHSMFNIQQKITPSNGNLIVELECIRPDVEILYTTDGSIPNVESKRYVNPITLQKDTDVLRAATFKDGVMKGEILELPFLWNKATGKEITGIGNERYVLTNGIKGSLKYTDSEWALFDSSENQEVLVDLGSVQPIEHITLGFINNYGMGVHRPENITISASTDNLNYDVIGQRSFSPEDIFAYGTERFDESFNFNDTEAQYIKIKLDVPPTCPPQHVRPGKAVQSFIDEIIID